MATKTKKKPLSPAIEDIEHEHVVTERAPAVTQPQEAVVVEADEDPAKTLELTIQREIKKFGLADAGIEELKKKYGELTIADVEDRAGYEAVKKAWNEVRTTRTALEKKGLDIRGTYTKINKAVSVEEDRLITLLKPLENDLQVKWKKIDDDKEAEKQRKIKEEQERLQARVDELVGAGCALTDGYYGIGGTIAIDVATLRAMPDDKYAGLLTAVQAKAVEVKAEADRLAQKKLLEDEKLLADQQKLKDDQAELEKQKKKLKDDQDELDRLRNQAAETKRETRLDRLQVVGLTLAPAGDHVLYDNGFGEHSLWVADIVAADDDAFKAMVAAAKERVAELQQGKEKHDNEVEKERTLLEDKKVKISDFMATAGLTYLYRTESFQFKNDVITIDQPMAELIPKDLEFIVGLADELKDRIIEAKAKQADEELKKKNRLEAERQAKLGDSERLIEYFTALGKVPLPELKSDAVSAWLSQFCGEFAILMDKYRPAPEAVPS